MSYYMISCIPYSAKLLSLICGKRFLQAEFLSLIKSGTMGSLEIIKVSKCKNCEKGKIHSVKVELVPCTQVACIKDSVDGDLCGNHLIQKLQRGFIKRKAS